MVKKLNLTIISGILILLFFSQIIISFFVEPEIFWRLGTMHYLSLVLFLIFFILAQRIAVREVFVLILFYQLFLVFSLFTYFIVVYNSPLGFEPVDEGLYHYLGQELKDKSFLVSIEYLKVHQDISDFGFPLLVKFIYSLGGDGILIMKLMNIIFHLITCVLIFKLGRLIFSDENVSKYAVLLYGLSPISVFFNASGFKEPFFTLIVVLCFYLLYKAYLEKKLKFLILGLLALLGTGTFRITFPIFIFLSFGYYSFINVSGKHRFLIRGFFILCSIFLGGLLFQIFQNEFQSKMAVDSQVVVAHRLGRVPGFIDYIVMAVSGLIGPIPTFSYTDKEELNLLQAAGNFIKLFFSFFFLIGCYYVIRKKIKILYPLMMFILANVIMLTLTSLSLLHRFHYPFTPFFFLLVAFGLNIFQERRISRFLIYSYFFFIFILIVGYNLR